MVKLWIGVVLFGGGHLLPMLVPALRVWLARRLGENTYKGLYSLVAATGLVFLVLGYVAERGTSNNFYIPIYELRHFTMLLVLIGFILIFSNGTKGYIRKWVRHPFSWGIGIWSVGHLLANGERAVVVIFFMFLVLSLADIIINGRRKTIAAFTPNPMHDLRGLVAGVVLYLVFLFGFHPYVLQIPVL